MPSVQTARPHVWTNASFFCLAILVLLVWPGRAGSYYVIYCIMTSNMPNSKHVWHPMHQKRQWVKLYLYNYAMNQMKFWLCFCPGFLPLSRFQSRKLRARERVDVRVCLETHVGFFCSSCFWTAEDLMALGCIFSLSHSEAISSWSGSPKVVFPLIMLWDLDCKFAFTSDDGPFKSIPINASAGKKGSGIKVKDGNLAWQFENKWDGTLTMKPSVSLLPETSVGPFEFVIDLHAVSTDLTETKLEVVLEGKCSIEKAAKSIPGCSAQPELLMQSESFETAGTPYPGSIPTGLAWKLKNDIERPTSKKPTKPPTFGNLDDDAVCII